MTITERTAVGELAATIPESVRVFQRHGLDFCCGGQKSLAALCEEAGLSFDAIAQEIEAEPRTAGAPARDWAAVPLGGVIDHIIATYHDPLRRDLPELQILAETVLRAHGSKSPVFARVQQIVSDLSADLLAHMMKEEVVLFPAIRRVEAGEPSGVPLDAPIGVMQAEHEEAGELLRELRSITGDYRAPAWACATLRALYARLEAFEQAMHVHVHLENNILFPRATRGLSTAH